MKRKVSVKEKKCSKCKDVKLLEEFGVKKYNKDGLNHYCKVCENNRSKNRYSNPEEKERRKYYQILKNYGLSKDEYFLKLEKQNFECTICSTKLLNDKDTHVDHCHLTGKVRDILCKDCNHLLGMVNEDVNYLNSIINYLEKYSPQK